MKPAPFNADKADLVGGRPSNWWLHKNHPDALKKVYYDVMVYATEFEFVSNLLEEARRKGYFVSRADPSDCWLNERLKVRDKDRYGVYIHKNVTWTRNGIIGTSELMYHPTWHKKYGMVDLWNDV